MTYLEMVNKVLVRLREKTVSTVGETDYSALVGEFVNDAKTTVEDAWDWSALRQTLTVTTSPDIFNYALTNSQNRAKILDVINQEKNYFLKYETSHWFNNAYLNGAVSSAPPMYYSFNGVNANGDSLVDLYPNPDGVYKIFFNVVLPQGHLSGDADVLKIPSMPVVQLATAMAMAERGETGGTTASEMFAVAKNTLSDAIALDATRHPEELIYTVV